MQRRDSRLPVPDPSVPHCHENLTVSCSIAATVLPTRFTALLRPVLPSTTTLPPAFHTSNKRHALKFTHTKASTTHIPPPRLQLPFCCPPSTKKGHATGGRCVPSKNGTTITSAHSPCGPYLLCQVCSKLVPVRLLQNSWIQFSPK